MCTRWYKNVHQCVFMNVGECEQTQALRDVMDLVDECVVSFTGDCANNYRKKEKGSCFSYKNRGGETECNLCCCGLTVVYCAHTLLNIFGIFFNMAGFETEKHICIGLGSNSSIIT